jgi:endonuclease YncB( thermonuclease family)
MISNRMRAARRCRPRVLYALCVVTFATIANPARAADCMFEPQGEGRVVAVIDSRTFRLEDGREIRLAGIEPIATEEGIANGADALAALVLNRNVTLRGENDSPDRYGRQPAFVFLDPSDGSVQGLLVKQGKALVSPTLADKACAASLILAETAARLAKQGIWSNPAVILSAGNPGTILARIGQFTVVEGKVLSVREAGATTYINFGRRWTQDFAVTISRRMLPAFEAAGIALKSLENRRIRVRGWIEARGGPRIEALQTGQIELLGDN